ncbi:hypothetical protein [Thermaurantiacus sp.]
MPSLAAGSASTTPGSMIRAPASGPILEETADRLLRFVQPVMLATPIAAASPRRLPANPLPPGPNMAGLRADVDLATGEELRLQGACPHAREMGPNVHRRPPGGTLASVPDTALKPRCGPENPFRPGARRAWVLVLAPAHPPAIRGNRLGLGWVPDHRFEAWLLPGISVPNEGRPVGGAATPRVFHGPTKARIELASIVRSE